MGVREREPFRDIGDQCRIGRRVRCQLGGRNVNGNDTNILAVLKVTGEGTGAPATYVDDRGSRAERADSSCDGVVVSLIESNVLTRIESTRKTRVCVDESSEEGDLRPRGLPEDARPDACAV